MTIDVRREKDAINDELDRFWRTAGQYVWWAPFDPVNTTIDPVYNEPGQRMYLQPIKVQMLWVNVTESGASYNPERTDTTDTIRMAISIRALRECGVPNVDDSGGRILDMFKYRDLYWEVQQYEILERLAGDDIIVQVQGVQAILSEDNPFEANLPLEPDNG